MKKKIAIYGALYGILLMTLIFMGGLGDAGAPPKPVEEDYCYYYQYTGHKLGVQWEWPFLVDMFRMEAEGAGDLSEYNYLETTLDFIIMNEDVYRYKNEYDETTGEAIGGEWIFDHTNHYQGAAEIFAYFNMKTTERDVDVLLKKVEAKTEGRIRLSLSLAEQSTVLNGYGFPEETKNIMAELVESHYYEEVYGKPFGMAGGDVCLEDLDIAPNGMAIPLYLQYSGGWQDVGFGGGNIASSGCSVTCMGMVFTYLLEKTVTPDQVAAYAGNRYYVHPAGQSWGIFPACASQWKVKCKSLGKDTQALISALSNGKPVIASMSPGTFTKGGHFIVLRGVTSQGTILVNDPNDNSIKNFINREFDLSLILREAKAFWSFST